MIGWIRGWWARRWISVTVARQQAELRQADQKAGLLLSEAYAKLETRVAEVTAELETLRARRALQIDVSRDLANILTGFAMLWERVKVLDAKLGGTLWDPASGVLADRTDGPHDVDANGRFRSDPRSERSEVRPP